MKRTRITKQDIFFFTMSVFLVVVAWIGFDIYHSVVTSTISTILQTQIVPISERFDTTTLNQLQKRTRVMPQDAFIAPSPNASHAAELPSVPEITGQP